MGSEDSFDSSAGDFTFRCCTGGPSVTLSLHACTAVQLLESTLGVFCRGLSKKRALTIALFSVRWFVDLGSSKGWTTPGQSVCSSNEMTEDSFISSSYESPVM